MEAVKFFWRGVNTALTEMYEYSTLLAENATINGLQYLWEAIRFIGVGDGDDWVVIVVIVSALQLQPDHSN